MDRLATILLGLFFVFAIVSAAEEGNKEGSVPPFLEGADKKTIEGFQKVMEASGGKKDKEIEEAVNAWVEKQNDSIKTKYGAFKESMKKNAMEADSAHKAAVEKFSKEAKEADAKLTKISSDQTLTSDQKGAEIKKIFDGLKPNVREEIEKAMQG